MYTRIKKSHRALTIAASGFGGGMLGLWALNLATSLSAFEQLPIPTIGGMVAGLSALCASTASVAFFSGIDENESYVKKTAMIDPLTDLFSKSGLIEIVEKQLSSPKQDKRRSFLLDVEIDRFKDFNDIHGFSAGDDLIRQVGNRIEKMAGTIGQVGRFGGGEFGLILETRENSDEIEAVSDHLIEVLSGTYMVGGIVAAVTCSLGIVEIVRGNSVAETVRGAHMALKQTRLSGRGCWTVYSNDMSVREDFRTWVEVEMRDALKRGEFSLHYQPQYNVIDGSIRGFEALLRWKHPHRGYIPPLDFISIAEENGFINNLGRWAITQACRDAVEFPDDVPIAVNISPVQFLSGDIAKVVSTALQKTGLPPHRLELEVTESTLIDDRTRAAEIFVSLATLGVSIAIDDFGTGYSNLGYLADLPFKKLKIDKSFIDRLEKDMHIAQIVSAIIALARALGATAVAEGVETENQAVLLRAAGCTVIQGFLYGRPQALQHAILVRPLEMGEAHGNSPAPYQDEGEQIAKVA